MVGYWSAGTRLADSVRVAGDGVEPGEFPEYTARAQRRARPTARRRRRGPRVQAGPSLHTGRQTEKKRKAGGRVTGQNAFIGQGKTLNEAVDDDGKAKGTGFGKRAHSKRAREERAIAVERRLKAMQSQSANNPTPSTSQLSKVEDLEQDSDSDGEESVAETNDDRRKIMFDATQNDDVDDLKFKLIDHFGFRFPSHDEKATSTGSSFPADSSSTKKDKDSNSGTRSIKAASSSRKTEPMSFALGSLVKDEISQRKKESLGPGSRSLVKDEISQRKKESLGPGSRKLGGGSGGKKDEPRGRDDSSGSWDCLVCTLSVRIPLPLHALIYIQEQSITTSRMLCM
ncbi:hypothetical protein HWV62_37892 [Athelia sp. TMB]|nr:hypothetical protein HWV62_37892 [Athelia sp. TMB]